MFDLMQDNPNAAPYRNGLPMLHLYQDIFEGQGASGSFAYHSTSTYTRPTGLDDVPTNDEDDLADETMNTRSFSPSINTSSRSIGKDKGKGRRYRGTRADHLIDVMEELVSRVRTEPNDRVEDVHPAQSSVSPLEKSSLILQEMSLDAGMYTFLLDYLLKNPNLQPVFNNMDPNLRVQWVHIIASSAAAPPPPSYTPHPPPSF